MLAQKKLNELETNAPSPPVPGTPPMGVSVVQQYTAVLQEIARRHRKEVPPSSPVR
jgi:hypothetical protein